MSSSQGANATIVSGYPFKEESIRDSSDWIRFKREGRVYANYKSGSTANKDTGPVWAKYGNNFKLSYSFGRFKCEASSCAGNVFNGSVGGQTSVG